MNPVKRCYGDGAKKGGDEGCDGGADDDGGSFPVPVWRGVVSAFVRCFFPCFSVWVSSLVTGRSCMFVRTLGRTSVPFSGRGLSRPLPGTTVTTPVIDAVYILGRPSPGIETGFICSFLIR